MNRADKAAIIAHLKSRASCANFAVVTDFKGMPVEELTKLRVVIRKTENEFYVVKNTLAKIAFSDTGHSVVGEKLKENCAIALGAVDPVALAKVVSDFAKTSKLFSVRYGCLDGKFLSAEDISALARLPSKPELIAIVLGTMNAVPTNFVGLFANILRGLLYALKAIEEKKAAA